MSPPKDLLMKALPPQQMVRLGSAKDHPEVARRDLLRMFGAAALSSLPVLPSLLPREARAQASAAPLRFVFLMNRNGQMEENFYPAAATAQVQAELYAADLAGIAGDISPIFGPAWSGLRQKMTILRGLDIIGPIDHSRGTFLCGVHGNAEYEAPRFGASIDWLLEKSTAVYATPRTQTAIRYSNNGGRGFSFKNVGGVIDSLPYLETDAGVFNDMFGSSTGPAPTADPNQRKSYLLDRWQERMAALLQNSRLGAADRQRLQQHVDNMTALKAGLAMTAAMQCTAPTLTLFRNGDLIRRRYENLSDTIVAAFACDKVRIASMFIEDFDDASTDYSYFHNLSHADPSADLDARQKSAAHNRWIADRVAYLVNKLNSTLDVDGRPLLDNTVVVWGNEISNYWHRSESIPTMIAGSGKGKFLTGKYLDYRQRPFKYYANRGDFPAVGRPYTQFLCSIMLAAGLQPAEFTPYGTQGKFGDYTFGTYDNGEYVKYSAVRNDPLPVFYIP